MVVATTTTSIRSEKIRHIELPLIDLKGERSEVARQIMKACETYGFFKVINHNVSNEIISNIEKEGMEFFGKPQLVKQEAGPPNPYGYGNKIIGSNGDRGELEYIILHTNPLCISDKSLSIATDDPIKFRCAVNSYIKAVRELACDILEVISEGLGVPLDTSALSRLIWDVENDSLFRINHYPPLKDTSASSFQHLGTSAACNNQFHPENQNSSRVIGFGEHTDPQMMTILRSNGVGGLQISVEDGVWVPVSPQPPSSFCVFIGDLLQVMTNGKFQSVRHRVSIVNTREARMSMAYFATPPLTTMISPIPELVAEDDEKLYRSFTWAEFKKTTHTRRLIESRLGPFMLTPKDEDK